MDADLHYYALKNYRHLKKKENVCLMSKTLI